MIFLVQSSRKSHLLEERGDFDVDSYDHRSEVYMTDETSASASASPVVEASPESDIDDYDHRSLYETKPPPPPSKRADDTDDGVEEENMDDFDHRSKWALGNLTTKDIQDEQIARAKMKAAKQASMKIEKEIELHAWG